MRERTAAEKAERRLITSLAGIQCHIVNDSDAIAARARAGLEARFLREAGGDERKAQLIKKAFYTRLALRRAQAAKAKERRDQAVVS